MCAFIRSRWARAKPDLRADWIGRNSLALACMSCSRMSAMLAMTAIASSVGALQYPSLRCFTRRHMIAGALSAIAGMPPCFAEESSSGGTYSKVGSERPGNNYYFPMARYRYCPRILRAWIAVDELGLQALKERDWEGVQIVQARMLDATTAMPLFTSSVEGARSTKRKKKSDTQKSMAAETERYRNSCIELQAAIDGKDEQRATTAFASAREALGEYRRLGKIDDPDGGMVVPENTAEGRGGVPDAQYVVPVFTGGGAMTSKDFRKLRD